MILCSVFLFVGCVSSQESPATPLIPDVSPSSSEQSISSAISSPQSSSMSVIISDQPMKDEFLYSTEQGDVWRYSFIIKKPGTNGGKLFYTIHVTLPLGWYLKAGTLYDDTDWKRGVFSGYSPAEKGIPLEDYLYSPQTPEYVVVVDSGYTVSANGKNIFFKFQDYGEDSDPNRFRYLYTFCMEMDEENVCWITFYSMEYTPEEIWAVFTPMFESMEHSDEVWSWK